MVNLTEQQVYEGACKRYSKSICLDKMEQALLCDTLEQAIDMIVIDSAYWDSPTGNPFDQTNLIK